MVIYSSLFQALRTALILLALFWAPQAKAHELRPAIADMSFDNGQVRIDIALNLEAALAGIGPDHDDTENAPQAATYDALRASTSEALSEAFGAFSEQFISQLTVKAGANALSPRIQSVKIPDTGDTDLARESVLTIEAGLIDKTTNIVFGWDASLGPLILRAPGESANTPYNAYLQDGGLSDPIALTGAKAQGVFKTIGTYIYLGFTHILPKGLDHILFVVGLFLLSARLGPLLWQVTSFTLAHTVTLALGILGIVTISPAIVEPLIAASIVYVCIENILSDRLGRWRTAIVFGFGLLHGLGFAGVLGELGLPQGQFITALLSFNVGVELGQLTVIALCFLTIGIWFRNKPWYRARVTIPASAAIAFIGAYWFVERTFLS